MKKESRDIATAFKERRCVKRTRSWTNGDSIYLHGSRIFWRTDTGYAFSMCGWPTATTRDRINAAFRVLGLDASVSQLAHEQYYYDRGKVCNISSRDSYDYHEGVLTRAIKELEELARAA